MFIVCTRRLITLAHTPVLDRAPSYLCATARVIWRLPAQLMSAAEGAAYNYSARVGDEYLMGGVEAAWSVVSQVTQSGDTRLRHPVGPSDRFRSHT